MSLRNVAAAVGARAPSLYWHVKNKEALFGLMCEQIFRECLAEVPEFSRLARVVRTSGSSYGVSSAKFATSAC